MTNETELTLTEWIADDPRLNETERAEMLAIVPTRGKNKGRLRSSLPAQGKRGRIAYNAAMLAICPQRAAIWSMMFEVREPAARALWDSLTDYCASNELALQVLGTRPYQFSLWAHHYDRDRCLRMLVAFRE